LSHRRVRALLVALGLSLLVVAPIRCGGGDRPEGHREVAAPSARVQRQGQRLYDHYCALCHGAAGEGDGFNAYNLDPRPQPFRENPFLQQAKDSDIAAVIAAGGRSVGKSVLMPPWGRTLTPSDITALVVHVRTLMQPPEPEPAAEEGEPTGGEPVRPEER
jgi:cytochrome c oxidase cbb3-type subunit 3